LASIKFDIYQEGGRTIMMSSRWVRGLMAWGAGLLLLGGVAAPALAVTDITDCGSFAGQNSYRLTADLVAATDIDCLVVTGNGATIDLNGHSIKGLGAGSSGAGITGGNNVVIKGPGVVAFFDTCISLGQFAHVLDVIAHDCHTAGIRLGNFSKCVQCRVHNVRSSETFGALGGIIIGDGCLLESSIVETSDRGAIVGHDCKVWDLVLEDIILTGLKVGPGTSVARTVISGGHDGPGIDYCDCGTNPITSHALPGASACQDSSNSVSNNGGTDDIADATTDTPYGEACDHGTPRVITDCATNAHGLRYVPYAPSGQCVRPGA
jgi:hypothetical protein